MFLLNSYIMWVNLKFTEHRKAKASSVSAEPCLPFCVRKCRSEGLYNVRKRKEPIKGKCLSTQHPPLGSDPKACQYFKSLSIFLKGSEWSWIYIDEEYAGWHFKIQAGELCYHVKWYSTSTGLLLNAIGIILLNIVNQSWEEKPPKYSFKIDSVKRPLNLWDEKNNISIPVMSFKSLQTSFIGTSAQLDLLLLNTQCLIIRE